jgi:hypothetical protein
VEENMDSFLQTDLPAIVWASFLAVVIGLYVSKVGRRGSRERRGLPVRLLIGLGRLIKVLIAITLIAVGIASFFLGRELQNFMTLGERTVVSKVQIWWMRSDSTGGHTMLSVSRQDDPLAQPNELVAIPSNYWAVEARVIRWPDWCGMFGFMPIYRISEILMWANPESAKPDSMHTFMFSRMGFWERVLKYGSYFEGFAVEEMRSRRVEATEGYIYWVTISPDGLKINEEYTKTVPALPRLQGEEA